MSVLNQAMKTTSEGNFEIDMHIIRQMAMAFDEGVHNEECIIAKFIVAAFEAGIEEGIERAAERSRQTAMLLACTAGNA
jgi:hypothetical protein